jgi:hypothetical protein
MIPSLLSPPTHCLPSFTPASAPTPSLQSSSCTLRLVTAQMWELHSAARHQDECVRVVVSFIAPPLACLTPTCCGRRWSGRCRQQMPRGTWWA